MVAVQRKRMSWLSMVGPTVVGPCSGEWEGEVSNQPVFSSRTR